MYISNILLTLTEHWGWYIKRYKENKLKKSRCKARNVREAEGWRPLDSWAYKENSARRQDSINALRLHSYMSSTHIRHQVGSSPAPNSRALSLHAMLLMSNFSAGFLSLSPLGCEHIQSWIDGQEEEAAQGRWVTPPSPRYRGNTPGTAHILHNAQSKVTTTDLCFSCLCRVMTFLTSLSSLTEYSSSTSARRR